MSARAPRADCAFVLGAPRSGSSLLQRLLGQHPDIWAPSETRMGSAVSAMLAFLERATRTTTGVPKTTPENAVLEFLDGTMRAQTLARGKRVWVEKTPENIRVAPELLRVFPKALYICLYRRYDDVIYSWLEAHEAGPRGIPVERLAGRHIRPVVDRLLRAWCTSTITCLELERQQRIRTVRVTYEDLVTRPRGALGRVERAIGVTASRRLRRFDEPDFGHADIKAQFATTVEDRRGKGTRIAQWLSDGSEYQRATRLLAALGYARTSVESEVRQALPSSGDAPGGLKDRILERARRRVTEWRPLAGFVEVGRTRWQVTLRNGAVEVRIVSKVSADRLAGGIIVAEDVASRIFAGEYDAGEAILSGKIKCVGDMETSKRLAWLAFGPDAIPA